MHLEDCPLFYGGTCTCDDSELKLVSDAHFDTLWEILHYKDLESKYNENLIPEYVVKL